MKKKKLLIGLAGMIILAAGIVFVGWDRAIFQRGNPLPYLLAMMRLDEDTPYVMVMETQEHRVYLTDMDGGERMIEMVEALTDTEFVEQAGRGFFFEGNGERFTAVNEVYFGRYLVWEVPRFDSEVIYSK